MNIDEHIQWLDRNDIRLGQDRTEITWLYNRVKGIPCKKMIEIGSRQGGTLYLLAQACQPGALIVSIDFEGYAWGRKGSSRNLKKVIKKLHEEGFNATHIEGLSQDPATVGMAKAATENEIDFLFIDGDHRFEMVLQDWTNYMGMVNEEHGAIAFHDIKHDERKNEWGVKGVDRLWQMLSPAYRSEEILEGPGIGIIYKGEAC